MQLTDVDWNAAAAAAGTGAGTWGVLRLVEGLAKLVYARLRDRDEHADKKLEREAEARRSQEAAEAAVRDELRAQISKLYERVDQLSERLDRATDRHLAMLGEMSELKAENHRIVAQSALIRAENHQMRNYMTILIVTARRYHDLLGFPPEDRPTVPSWLDEPARAPAVPVAEAGPTSA